ERKYSGFQPGFSLYSEVTRRSLRSWTSESRRFHPASLEVCRLAATIVGPLNQFCPVQPLEVMDMKSRPNRQFERSAKRQGSPPISKPQYLFLKPAPRAGSAGLLLLSLSCGVASAQDNGNSSTQLRRFVGQQVGGIDKLKVPATDAAIPLPRMP